MKSRRLSRARLFYTIWILLFFSSHSTLAQNRVLELDANDSWIELPADLLKDVKNELTVEGWIRWEQFGKFSRLFDFGPATRSFAVHEFLDTASLDVLVHRPGAVQLARAADVLRTNRWYHIACTISPDG